MSPFGMAGVTSNMKSGLIAASVSSVMEIGKQIIAANLKNLRHCLSFVRYC